MKKSLFYFVLISLFTMFSCSNEDDFLVDDTNSGIGGTKAAMSALQLNLDEFIGYDGLYHDSGAPGSYWTSTYDGTEKLQVGQFTFSHTAVESWNYWDGFVVSTVNDTEDHGFNGSGGSNGWLKNQWGCMDLSEGSSSAHSPFIVGYWSYYTDQQGSYTGGGNVPAQGTFDEEAYSCWVKIGDGQYKAGTIDLALNPWTYYGCMHGDGFARPLDQLGDYYKINIYAVDSEGEVKDKVVSHYFVNRIASATAPIEYGWKTVNISDLGNAEYLIFQLETTDSDPQWGPNTALYFCLRNIVFTN